MVGIIRFLQGYLKVKIFGFSPERFMNLCSSHHIMLWEIVHHSSHDTMCMSLQSFFRIKSFLRKTGTKVVVLEKHGLPFLMPRLRKRKVFLIGFLAILMVMVQLTNYIWAFEYVGNTAITDEYLQEYLSSLGIDYGCNQKKLDVQELEEHLLKDFELISWVSVTIEGTKLCVSLKENEYYDTDRLLLEKESGINQQHMCSNLVATKDGIVTAMVTRAGVPKVQVGDYVEEGDCLVEGFIPIYNDDGTIQGYQYANADATIAIQTIYEYYDEVELVYETNEYTQDSYTNYFVELFGHFYYLTAYKKSYLQWDSYTSKQQVKLLDHFYLPIYYGSTSIREFQKTQKKLTEQQASEYLNRKINQFMESFREKGVQIIENNVRIERKEHSVVAKGSFTIVESCVESIAVDDKILEESIDEAESL